MLPTYVYQDSNSLSDDVWSPNTHFVVQVRSDALHMLTKMSRLFLMCLMRSVFQTTTPPFRGYAFLSGLLLINYVLFHDQDE